MDRCVQGDTDTMGGSVVPPARPTAADIFRARMFEEPLVPMGAEPTSQENADFAAALIRYAETCEIHRVPDGLR
jgi:hypothetical protein